MPAELPHGVLIFTAIGYLFCFAIAWLTGVWFINSLIDRWMPGFWTALDDEFVPTPNRRNENGAG